jgi:2-polyprenyl-6-hydroxyphenyl methylase/3-demethylubiquinone-9 3-methyltransferase
MSIGPFVRRLFGPYEHQVGEVYRALYIDIDTFVELMRRWSPTASRILEVGCGEGSVTERLSVAYPEADISAIDITPRLGRLYRGSLDRVEFIRCTAQEMAATQAGHFDLVVLSDVLHHVPVEQRQSLLDAVRKTLSADGTLIFKDWERNYSLIHWLSYASDRWLTGDRISYMSRAEMRALLERSFGETALIDEARVAPRWNNLATLVRPPKPGPDSRKPPQS